MFDKLLATLKSSGVIAITIVMANSIRVNSQEYVFSAPSEVDYNSVEIPSSETEYPFYECEENQQDNQNGKEKIDSHECDCVDCESFSQDSETDEELTSKNQQSK